MILMNLFVLALGSSQGSEAAVVAVQRTDANSRAAHRQLVEKARRGRIDLYFVGDSITRRWGCSDPIYREFLENWQRNFHGWNAGNFGRGGDTTRNILWRLQNGELDGVDPKVIVLLAGTNDIGAGASATDVAKGVAAIVDLCLAKAPKATLVLMGVLPRNDAPNLMPTVRAANLLLARMANRPGVRFLDIGDRLADDEGELHEGMTVDGLHLGVKGYQAWADALRPTLTSLLGPPADIDLAPPPTGDPGLSG
ncbi:MAG TPA: GDSL-type esterase/lipase family protein [Fimbriimonas sp.]